MHCPHLFFPQMHVAVVSPQPSKCILCLWMGMPHSWSGVLCTVAVVHVVPQLSSTLGRLVLKALVGGRMVASIPQVVYKYNAGGILMSQEIIPILEVGCELLPSWRGEGQLNLGSPQVHPSAFHPRQSRSSCWLLWANWMMSGPFPQKLGWISAGHEVMRSMPPCLKASREGAHSSAFHVWNGQHSGPLHPKMGVQ